MQKKHQRNWKRLAIANFIALLIMSALFITSLWMYASSHYMDSSRIISECRQEAFQVKDTSAQMDTYLICINQYIPLPLIPTSVFELTPTLSGLQR